MAKKLTLTTIILLAAALTACQAASNQTETTAAAETETATVAETKPEETTAATTAAETTAATTAAPSETETEEETREEETTEYVPDYEAVEIYTFREVVNQGGRWPESGNYDDRMAIVSMNDALTLDHYIKDEIGLLQVGMSDYQVKDDEHAAKVAETLAAGGAENVAVESYSDGNGTYVDVLPDAKILMFETAGNGAEFYCVEDSDLSVIDAFANAVIPVELKEMLVPPTEEVSNAQ